MTDVMAQGVFDLLHPGHLHYLEKAAELGDKLTVVVARDSHVARDSYFSEEERRKMVSGLKPVDEAVLGSEKSIYRTLEKVKPDVIALGFDQKHSEKRIQKEAEQKLGERPQVVRIEGLEGYSSSKIRDYYS